MSLTSIIESNTEIINTVKEDLVAKLTDLEVSASENDGLKELSDKLLAVVDGQNLDMTALSDAIQEQTKALVGT